MKKCTYCGKEYPEEAVVCAIDEEPLESDLPAPEPATETVEEDSDAGPDSTGAEAPTADAREVPAGYVHLADLGGFEADDLLGRFQAEGIRFLIDEVERTSLTGSLTGKTIRKISLVEICVHQDDYEKAHAIFTADWKV